MEIPAKFFNVSFNKAMAFGYKTEDVDEFVTQAIQYIKELQEDNGTLAEKMEVLAANLEKYREEEDGLRSALIGAHKLGDSILRESRSKAEVILRDATARADGVTEQAALELERQQMELDFLKTEVTGFKEKLFDLYRSHLEAINHIPSLEPVEKAHRERVRHAPPPPTHQEPEQADISDEAQTDDYDHQYAPEPVAETQPPEAQYPEDSYEPPCQPVSPGYGDDDDEPNNDFVTDEFSDSFADNQPEEMDEPDEEYNETQFAPEETLDFPEETTDFPAQSPQELSFTFEDDEPENTTFYEEEEEELEFTVEAVAEERVPVPDDAHVYIPRVKNRTGMAAGIFDPIPMVQMELESMMNDNEDSDFDDVQNLRSIDLTRIPYFDEEDEEDDLFENETTPKKKTLISKKFGELKFGDAFKLTDD